VAKENDKEQQDNCLGDAAAEIRDTGHVSCERNDLDDNNNDEPIIPGTPVGWKCPSAPEEWKPETVNRNPGEPNFDTVNNPGDWHSFVCRPKFKCKNRKKVDHLCHSLPTGATPVPADEDGKHQVFAGGHIWDFHHKGWKQSESIRHFATVLQLTTSFMMKERL